MENYNSYSFFFNKKQLPYLLCLLFGQAMLFSLTAQEAETKSLEPAALTSEMTPVVTETTDTTTVPPSLLDAPVPENESQLLHRPREITLNKEGNLTFTPGLRIQTRYDYEDIEKNNDFYIRRLRLKGSGNVFDIARYYFEVKIDNEGKFNRTPRAQVENAWLDFPIIKNLNIRVGLYDMVFSRSALTSDSKLLLMDRSMIKNALTPLGITDNTVGVLVHGRPFNGKLSYGFGVFDNLGFEQAGIDTTQLSRKSDGTMYTGRLGYDFLDPAPAGGYADYWGSYFGEGQRLTLSADFAYLSRAEIGNDQFTLFAWGADLFFNTGKITIQAEYDSFTEAFRDKGTADLEGSGWYAQVGYLFHPQLELAFRYQELDPNTNTHFDKLQWTSIGLNYYIRGHQLKIQTEYIFKREHEFQIDNNLFQAQLQLDF